MSRPGAGVRAEQIRNLPLIGWLAGRAFRLYREGSVTRIKTGVGKGLLWKRSHPFRNAFYLGTFEPDLQDFLARNLEAGSVFWDIGANAGFFSLLAARIVGSEGEVVAVEPFPDSAALIREQIRLNGFNGFSQVVEAAATASVGEASLFLTGHNTTHRLNLRGMESQGELRVPTISLDSLLDARTTNRSPDLVKVDVEGSEIDVLSGADHLLNTGVVWVIEAHDEEVERQLSELLELKGYRVSRLGERDARSVSQLIARIE